MAAGSRREAVGLLSAEEIRNGRRVTLPAWKVATGDRRVAEVLTRIHGGVHRLQRDERGLVCSLESASIRISLQKSADVVNRLILKQGNEVLHLCDGSRFLQPAARVGAPCGCPDNAFERRAAARAGTGPRPEVRIFFSLPEAPSMGMLALFSSSWELAESLRDALRGVDASATVDLNLTLRKKNISTRSGLEVSVVHPFASPVDFDPHRIAA